MAVCVVLLAALLCGCVTLQNSYDNIEPDLLQSIVIYDLHEEDRENGLPEHLKPVHYLDRTQHEPFLEALGEISFRDTLVLLPVAVDPSFSYGMWVVRLNFTDGSYRLISDCGYGEYFDAEGERLSSNHFGCSAEEWERLIEAYLP